MEDGIYIGMADDAYHAIPRLSASGIRVLLQSPADFWWQSWMNPVREPDNETAAKSIGKAYHCRILEGDDAFRARYCPKLEAADYPNALRTVDDLKEALDALGEKTTGNKPALAARLLDADPTAQIWELIASDYAERTEGAEQLSRPVWDRIQMAAAMIERHPVMSKMVRGGLPEIAILWTDHEFGVPMKAKLDYLKPGVIVDLKSFANPLGKAFDRAVTTAFASGRYQVQAATYFDAVSRIPDLVNVGAVFGEAPDWLIDLGRFDTFAPEFVFLFQQSTGAPIARAYRLPRGGLTADVGKVAAMDARRIYAEHMERFGPDMWIDDAPLRDFDDTEIPAYAFD